MPPAAATRAPLPAPRSAILEAWCRRQQRVWPALFCLRVAGRPGARAPAAAVAVAHADGSYHVALDGRRVALCDGCGGLVPAPLAAGAAPRRDTVAVCGVCGFCTALDPALRRALGRGRSVSAGMCLAEDVARVIVLEAVGPWGSGAEAPCARQQAFADSDPRRRRALQALVDLIGVEDCVPSAPSASDVESVLWRGRVEEGAWLLELISAVEGGNAEEHAVAGAASVCPDALIQAKLSFPRLQDDAKRKSACEACREAISMSRVLLDRVLGSVKDLASEEDPSADSWDSLTVIEEQSFVDRNAALSRKEFVEARRDLELACSSVRAHVLRCTQCLLPDNN